MKTLTCICMEDEPGYPDPLIYTVEVHDDITFDQLQALLRQGRIEELEEFETRINESFRLCFAFEGDHHPQFDGRI